MAAAPGRPKQGTAPSGGSAAHEVASVGAMLWHGEAIWQAVVPVLPGFTVEVVPEIDSTNSELMRRAKAGQLDPVLLVAERQTAGRGRLGRQWHSDAAGSLRSLTFSLGLPLAPANWSGLSLAVGVSVAQSLHPDLRLKWPNDIWLQDRKLGGILIETGSFGDVRFVVMGVGINIAPRDAAGLSTPPAWLAEVQPALDAGQALQQIVAPLVRAVLAFERQGFAPFQAGFNALDVLAGRVIICSDGTTGLAQGVDATGALRVQTEAGLRHITSAEVSVRPVAPQGLGGAPVAIRMPGPLPC
jgi:BirA family transcriptional regulator, biotin operon repressor / biotin---[acetyl-CoA-carboxylase] ligase